MSRRNFDNLRGGGDENNEDLQYGWRNTRRRTAYEHRGTSSSTPAQIMDQQTYYGYGWVSLVQAVHVLQLILLLLASFLRLRWFVDGVGDFMGNYTHYFHLFDCGVKVRKQCLLSFFVLNCYYCLDGTRSGYFGHATPTLEEYLPLDELLLTPPAVDLGDTWDFRVHGPHNV
jgi:hypothetical protein